MHPYPPVTPGPRSGAVPDPGFPGPPLHGYRGEVRPDGRFVRPRGLTLALSREAGARGTTIARKVGELLGWQVFDQETLDYLVQDETAQGQLLAELPDGGADWADAHLAKLQRKQQLTDDAETSGLAKLILVIAARGDAVIVGRGAGYLLPVESTLHARIVAPFEFRVGFLGQSLRLTRDEAAAEVKARDDRRAKFLSRALARDPADLTVYDVVVNSARLGVEGSAQFLGWAVRTKQMFAEIGDQADDPPRS